MEEWISRQQERERNWKTPKKTLLGTCNDTLCHVSKFVPARMIAKTAQRIPRVMFQTWKSNVFGKIQFGASSSFVVLNPEYDFVLFDDSDCLEFMCRFAEPDVQRAYSLIRPGAGKADIWRLVMLHEFGGIYVDIDNGAKKPWRDIIRPEASVVSGIGNQGDFHQWVLIYAPRHPIIREALRVVTRNVLDHFEKRKYSELVEITGPRAFHWEGVVPVLERNNCTVDKKTPKPGLQLIREGVPCKNMWNPEKIGFVQVFDSDYLGYSIGKKMPGIEKERSRNGVPHWGSFSTFSRLFTNKTSLDCH